MFHNPRTNHVEININEALNQVPFCFYRSSMIAIFPIGPFPILPLIELLPRPARNQLNRFRDDISVAIVPDQKMDMLCGRNIVEDA